MLSVNMKNKSSGNQNIISAIKKLEKSFTNKLRNTELALMIRIEERAEKTERSLKEEIRESGDNLMNKIDSFAGKTATLEEENTVGTHQIRELREEVDGHEKRIKQLESPAV